MRGERRKPAPRGCRVAWAMALCGAIGSQCALAQITPAGPAVRVDKGHIRRTPRTPADDHAECVDDTECSDGLACTLDVCTSEQTCANAVLPGCVPCTSSRACSPVDLVVVLDTSGSMRDEAVALCAGIPAVQAELQAVGIVVNVRVLGISETPRLSFVCVQDNVVNLLGADVAGPAATCPFPNGSAPFESWGPAAAIVAERYPWGQGARIIVPISDEGPCNGDVPEGCNDPGDDRDSIDNAIAVAADHGVVISPVAGTHSSECALTLMQALAAGTAGRNPWSANPATDLADAIRRIVMDQCPLDVSCDDGRACTQNDTCTGGICTGTQIADCRDCAADTDCDDQNGCTDDACFAGVCQSTPNLEPCDDGAGCTVLDQCNPSGECAGVDLGEIPCDDDADCFGDVCNPELHRCVCSEAPRLCVRPAPESLPEGECYGVGQEFSVEVTVGRTELRVTAGQFLIHYDPAVFSLIGISPGGGGDGEPPFSVELARHVDTQEGTVFFAVGVPLGSTGVRGPAALATMKFTAVQACGRSDFCFLEDHLYRNLLADHKGRSMPFELCCSGVVNVAGTPPRLTCPGNVSVDPPAGRVTADVAWEAPTAVSECDGPIAVSCTAENSAGHSVSDLVTSGGEMPPGDTVFACTAVDACGQESTCAWLVQVSDVNLALATVQFSESMAAGPVERCLEFAFYSSCQQEPVIVTQTVQLGANWHYPGWMSNIALSLPAGSYACATARDPKHTLRSTWVPTVVNGRYSVRFRADPLFGGNWLVNGDLNGDSVIDLLDYEIVEAQLGMTIDPGTSCEMQGFHADINGDGVVDLADADFVISNFLRTDMPGCCGSGSEAASVGLSESGSEELQQLGIAPSDADANADGFVDDWDVVRFLQAERTRLSGARGADRESQIRARLLPGKSMTPRD